MTVTQEEESKDPKPIMREPDPEPQLNIEAPGRPTVHDDEPGDEQKDDEDRTKGGK